MSTALDRAYQPGMGAGIRRRFPTPLERLIHLRTLPNLGMIQRSGLSYIAQRSEERFFARGETVFEYDDSIDSIHFIVEGSISVDQEEIEVAVVKAPFAVGFHPVLSTGRVHQRMVALEDTVTLEISAAEMLSVIEEDFAFLETGLRQMTRQLVETQAKLETQGELARTEPDEVPYPVDELDIIQRLVTARTGPLETANLEPLMQLVRQFEEIRVEPGHTFWSEGDEAHDGLTIVYGVVSCKSEQRTFRMGPGSSVGHLEAYGSLPRSYHAVAETKIVALRGSAESFFDVLEDHFELAMATMGFVCDRLLELNLRVAKANAQAL
ncbi:MAG: CRP-like cAMP-binding protein [Polyangiales bacterium]|jgi:CRP-like cAMP-binding protein